MIIRFKAFNPKMGYIVVYKTYKSYPSQQLNCLNGIQAFNPEMETIFIKHAWSARRYFRRAPRRPTPFGDSGSAAASAACSSRV